MPGKFEFVSAFLCERVLFEAHNVLSAIRIVDVFAVPEDAPPNFAITFFVVASFRNRPFIRRDYHIEVTLIRPSGERTEPTIIPKQSAATAIEGGESMAAGINIVLQMNVVPRNLGNCSIEIAIDGEPEVLIPFTLRRGPLQPLTPPS
jgi:hypothetical protein